jgi:hypothetical protein
VGLRAAWRELTIEHRRWLFVNAILIAALVNAALNALIAWGSAAGEDQIPLWAAPLVEGPSTITDTVGTFFILPFLTTLAITTVTWHELREGRLSQVRSDFSKRFRSLPERRLRRGAYFGALCVILFAPAAVLLLLALDYSDIGVGEFVLFKAIFGVVLGLVVTPVIAVAALHDPPEVYGQASAVPEPVAQPDSQSA